MSTYNKIDPPNVRRSGRAWERGPEWERWFAWFPVYIRGGWVWFRFVGRVYLPEHGWLYSFVPLETK